MENLKILIVEDDAISKVLLKKTLESIGIRKIVSTTTGFEAIDIIRLEKIDLVLMDISLEGGLDGIDTAKLIGSHLPIIYISGNKDSETFKRLSQVPSFGYISKPYTQQTIRLAIENIVKNRV